MIRCLIYAYEARISGEQSVGKSYMLNHLVDTSFAGSAMRTTEGVWMSVTPTDEELIVALDFEGSWAFFTRMGLNIDVSPQASIVSRDRCKRTVCLCCSIQRYRIW